MFIFVYTKTTPFSNCLHWLACSDCIAAALSHLVMLDHATIILSPSNGNVGIRENKSDRPLFRSNYAWWEYQTTSMGLASTSTFDYNLDI